MADTFVLNSSEADKAPGLNISKTAGKDVKPVICSHPGCTNEVKRAPTGRPAKFCDEHRGGRAKQSPNKSALTGKTWAEAAEVEAILTQFATTIAGAVTLVNAADGSIIATGGPKVVHELVELAKDDTSLRKYLTSLTAPGKYGPLIMTTMFSLVLPLMANHGALKLNVNLSDAANVANGGKKS